MADRIAELNGDILYLQCESQMLKHMMHSLIVDMAMRTENPHETANAFLVPHALAAKMMQDKATTPEDRIIADGQAETLKAFGEGVLRQIDMNLKAPTRPQ